MKKTILLLLVALLTQTANATVLIVNNNTNAPVGHYPSLQGAINAASNGDTIYVVGSPTTYGNANVAGPNIALVLIGPGYRPQKDNPFSARIANFNAATINTTVGNNYKILGFEITGKIGKDNVSCCGAGGWEVAYNKFSGSGTKIMVGASSNIHDNYFEVPNYTFSGHVIELRGGNANEIHNNVFCRLSGNFTLIGDGQSSPFNTNSNLIYNNHFISISGGRAIGRLYNSTIENNLFDGIDVADTNSTAKPIGCTINSCLTSLPLALFGTNVSTFPNYFGLFTSAQYQNPNAALGGAFDFPPYDYSLTNASIGYNGGTGGTQIGAFGGLNPFDNFTGAHPSLPQITKLDLANHIIGVNDQLVFRTTGFANSGDSIVEAEYFFDVDTNGTAIPIIISGTTFDVTIPITHGIADSPAEHVIGIRVKSSNGIWSIPEMRTFRVCAVSGALPHFNAYVSGYDVILENNSTDQHSCVWTFGDGNFSTDTSTYLVHQYDSAGVFNLCLDANNPCTYPPLSNNHLCKTITVKGINTISPSSGGSIGVVTVTITGAGFNDSVLVRLTKIGETDILPIDSSTIVTNGTNIQTGFDLNGTSIGLWNVVIEVPNDTTFIVLDGFEIDTGKFPEVYIELIGSNRIRLNRWSDINFSVGNRGNVDAVGATFWIALPSNIQIVPKFNINHPNDTILNLDWDTIPEFIVVDTIFDNYYNYKVFGLNIPSIAAGQSKPYTFSMKTTQILSNVPVLYWTSRPAFSADSAFFYRNSSATNNCYFDPEKANCIADAILGFGSCAANVLDYAYRPIVNSLCYNDPKIDGASAIEGVVLIAATCNPLVDPYSLTIKALSTIYSAAKMLDRCRKAFADEITKIGNFFSLNSFDPNEKYGSTGFLNSPYFNSQSAINYSIHYENADTATAPAQTVLLIDTLDKAKLDLSTFQLTSFGFADTIISIPMGRKSFTVNIDMQPIQLIAQLTAYLNDSTGILTTVCRSLDPLTMLPTDSVLLGFLLPNDSTGRGEGFVSFSVNAHSSVQTGDTINNKADIFFDENAPIATPTWTNIIDNLKPQGQVISAIQIPNTDSINVSWASTDNGPAGVYAHNVYYNINGGDWLLWKFNTSLTSDIFVGVMDSTYGFYSIAIDSAYNVEDTPLTPDVTTTLTVDVEELQQSQMIVKLFPNPANSTVSVFIKRFDNSKTDFSIIARDVTGRTIRKETLDITTETKTVELDLSQFVSGVYFFEITDGTHRTFRKLIKN